MYRAKYRSRYELRKAIDNYVTFYNTKRPHSKNQNKTPMAKEIAENRKTPIAVQPPGFGLQ